MTIKFDEQEDEYWTCTEYTPNKSFPSFRLTLQNMETNAQPSQEYQNKVLQQLTELPSLILQACEHILKNYSYEHYKNLNVPDEFLEKEETAEAISSRVQLVEIFFYDSECEVFEMSFHVPWDKFHSYDVEFEDGEAVCCAVNG